MLRKGLFTAVAMAALYNAGCAGQGAKPEHQQHATDPAANWMDSSGPIIDPYEPRSGRERPLVAVVGPNDGVEVTDFVVPHGILVASGEADVLALSTEPGPIAMFPALTFQPDATIAEFDRRYPDGADYVVVPAIHDPDHRKLTAWIQEQADRGATIVGVCDGVLVLAGMGLLEGRRATGHWFSMSRLERRHPGTQWVRNQRYVADENVITTTGVSASVPVSLALVEAIAGPDRARQLATALGVTEWGVGHRSDAFGIDARHLLTGVANLAAFWRRETVGIEVEHGVDEISLALVADAWARTYRSSVATVALTDGPVRTRGGLRLLPDRTHDESARPDRMLTSPSRADVGSALDYALRAIAESYGERTAAFVALQLEYDWATGGDRTPRSGTAGG